MLPLDTTMRDILPYIYGSLASQLFCFVLNVAIGILFAMANHNLTMRMRKRLFRSILAQEVGFFDKEQVYDITFIKLFGCNKVNYSIYST